MCWLFVFACTASSWTSLSIVEASSSGGSYSVSTSQYPISLSCTISLVYFLLRKIVQHASKFTTIASKKLLKSCWLLPLSQSDNLHLIAEALARGRGPKRTLILFWAVSTLSILLNWGHGGVQLIQNNTLFCEPLSFFCSPALVCSMHRLQDNEEYNSMSTESTCVLYVEILLLKYQMKQILILWYAWYQHKRILVHNNLDML